MLKIPQICAIKINLLKLKNQSLFETVSVGCPFFNLYHASLRYGHVLTLLPSDQPTGFQLLNCFNRVESNVDSDPADQDLHCFQNWI